jgi:hypothetical protein
LASEGGESKLLFHRRNKKVVAERTHNSGNAALKTRRGEALLAKCDNEQARAQQQKAGRD